MSYDIIVRFPSKKIADKFCGEMSDGVGEGFCDWTRWQQLPGTTGKKKEDFVKVKEGDLEVFFVKSIESF